MEVLIIWNKVSCQYIVEKAKKNYPKLKDKNLNLVTDSKELEGFHIDEFKPDYIYILVELLWEGKDLFHGYSVALDLLQSSFAKNHPLQIGFFSFFPRPHLFKRTKGLTNVFPYSFPHNQLPLGEKENIKTPSFSLGRWKFIRKYGITLSGVLDKIIHDYNKVLKIPANASSSQVTNLISRLDGISDLMGTEIQEFLAKIESREDYVNHGSQLLQLINESIAQANLAQDEVKVPRKKSWRPSVMIVEDDKDFREVIERKLEDYFDTTSFSSGIDAINELELKGNFYDGLVCDLELLEKEGFEQEKHGLDVIEYVEKRFPSVVVNVLTNMPKAGVRDLLPNNLDPKNIHYKSTFEIYQNHEWQDYIHFLKTQFRENAKNKMLPGPNTSIWKNVSRQNNEGGGLKLYYYTIKQHDEEAFDTLWAEIFHDFQKVMDGEKHISSIFPKPEKRKRFIYNYLDEEIVNYLKTFLLHRLFWLNKLYNGSNSSYYSINDEDVKFFDKPFSFFKSTNAQVDKRHNAYSPLLGFTLIKITENKYKFQFNILFPKEVEWVKETQGNISIDFINDFSYLSNTIDRILSTIKKAHPHAFNKSNYEKLSYPEGMADVEKVLKALEQETAKKMMYSDRQTVVNFLRDFSENATEEFNMLSEKNIKLINLIIARLDIV